MTILKSSSEVFKVLTVNQAVEIQEALVSEVEEGDRLLCWGNAIKIVTKAGSEHKAVMHKIAVEGPEVISSEQADLEVTQYQN